MSRFQLSRANGFKMPGGGISAARPSALGNPFKHADAAYAVKAFMLYARAALVHEDFEWAAVSENGKPTGRLLYKESLPHMVLLGTLRGRHDPKTWSFTPFDGFEQPLTLVQMPNMPRFATAFWKLNEGQPIGCYCALPEDGRGLPCHVDVILELQKTVRHEGTGIKSG